ncbi:hypothetical protein C8J57DRAFT_1538522 [Mycena rebaudengoi]|nr:hypothetical protein C8J57DRAFT_1538522 [Mycena rebaudengoi]
MRTAISARFLMFLVAALLARVAFATYAPGKAAQINYYTNSVCSDYVGGSGRMVAQQKSHDQASTPPRYGSRTARPGAVKADFSSFTDAPQPDKSKTRVFHRTAGNTYRRGLWAEKLSG